MKAKSAMGRSLVRGSIALLFGALSLSSVHAQLSSAAPVKAPPLEEQFANPPKSAAPRLWWHWMNGNVTKEGIQKDLEWMDRIGIGGLQNFDANIDTPQIVQERLSYMSPEWKDAFRFAVSMADRLGLEFAIASSPGWSETGGPWVSGEDGMKKLVWSETTVDGGGSFNGVLRKPPTKTGAYQTLGPVSAFTGLSEANGVSDTYRDVAVLAMPDRSRPLPIPAYTLSNGKTIDAAILNDEDYVRTIQINGPEGQPTAIIATFGKPQIVRSMTLYVV